MEAPTPDYVRRSLASLDPRQQKIVAGLLTVMVGDPGQVRDREWIGRQLTELVLVTESAEIDSPEQAVRAVQEYLEANATNLLNGAFLLFQRVGLDLAPRASEGFNLEDAVLHGLGYLPSSASESEASARTDRDLGEQPLVRLMTERDLKPKDLVAASSDQLTHKMVTRAMKGRRLTANTMGKVLRAWNSAAQCRHAPSDLFDYLP